MITICTLDPCHSALILLIQIGSMEENNCGAVKLPTMGTDKTDCAFAKSALHSNCSTSFVIFADMDPYSMD